MPRAKDANRGGRGNIVPIERKRAAGNPGRKAIPDESATAPVASVPADPPESLGEAGKGLWVRTAKYAERWVGVTDIDLLMSTCQLADQVDSLRVECEQLAREGNAYVVSKHGSISAHPAFDLHDRKLALLVGNLKLLGLTPVDRSRIGVAEVKATSKLQQQRDRRAAGKGD